MQDVTRIFKSVERLDAVDKKHETLYLSAKIIGEELHNDKDLTESLATIIIGEALSGAGIDEKEYLLVYPSLATVFGSGYSLTAVKKNLGDVLIESNRKITDCAEKLGNALKETADGKKDVLTLCALVYSYARRPPLKSKLYLTKLSMLLR